MISFCFNFLYKQIFSIKRKHFLRSFHQLKQIILQAERIIGVTESSGELLYLIKWKGSDEADLDLADCDLVPASQVCISDNFIAYFSKSFEIK